MSKIPKVPDLQQLRETAEAKLGRQTLKLVDPNPGEELLHDLLHELGVHQIELEMQNEALRQAQLVIEESRDRYMDLYDFAPVGYLTLTRDGMISEANLTGAAMLGTDRKRLLQRRFSPMVEAVDRDRWDQFFAGMFQRDERQHCELSLKRSDHAAFHVQLDCLRIESGGLSSVRITLTDITGRKLNQEEVREKEEYFRMIAENTEDFIAVLDLKGKRLYNNSTYTRMFGDAERQDTVSFAEIHPDDREHVKQLFRETVASGDGVRADFRFVLADGSIRQMESRAGVVKDSKGMVSRVVVVARDITERKEAEEKIRNLAFYDLLTKLPNRSLINDRMVQAMAASKRSGRFAAMMFIDLDNFKPLNDRHGHAIGDLLLVEAARRIGNCVREVDTVSRFGGDEFVVLLSELDAGKAESMTEAGIVAEKIRVALAEPYLLATRQPERAGTTVTHHCTSSIGVVLFVNHEISTDEILKRADWAMYQAKNDGRNLIRFFDSSTPVGAG
ncbi:MAG TPA: sensor domain-containing diguanylate cyclase [Gallionella sp.]|nr:sensor domain-containing diguanylate cyclase [Gallionella sp.]